MINVAGFEEKFARAVDDGLIWKHVGHVAGCYLSNSGTDMVVFAHVPAGRERQFRDSKLIFSVEISEKSGERRFELDLGDQAVGVNLHRTTGRLRGSLACLRKQRSEWQGCEAI